MARSAGSGLRQLILLSLGCVGISSAAAPPPPGTTLRERTAASPAQDARVGASAAQPKPVAQGKAGAPDAAVLEYLGEFEQAGDGLDAMGLAEDDTVTPESAKGGRR